MNSDGFLGRIVERFRNRKKRFVYRSSVTGLFISKAEHDADPSRATKEEVL